MMVSKQKTKQKVKQNSYLHNTVDGDTPRIVLFQKIRKLVLSRNYPFHLQPERHDCPKVIYVRYIRKTWLGKFGQNVTTSTYNVFVKHEIL